VLFGLFGLAVVVPFVLLARGRVHAALPFMVIAGAVQTVGFQWLHRTGWADLPRLPFEGPAFLPRYIDPGTATVLVGGALLLVWLRPSPIGLPGLAAAVLPPLLLLTPGWLQDAGLLPDDFDIAIWPIALMLILLTYVGLVAYAAVDARPAIAVAVLLAVWAVDAVATVLKLGLGGYGFVLRAFAYLLALILPIALAAWLGTRRQARLPRSGTTT
jgi:hypothetical protein